MKTFQISGRTDSERIQSYGRIVSGVFENRLDWATAWVPSGGAGSEDTWPDLVLEIRPGIGAEGFAIEQGEGVSVVVTGNDDLGLLAGIGKFLRDGHWTEEGFTPGAWRGTSVPTGSMRGMYFAFHNNWYSKAPLEKVLLYIEDLALWGMNNLALHLHQYSDLESLEAKANFERNHAIVAHAKSLGLRVGLLNSVNMAAGMSDDEAPAHILAAEFPDTDPARRGFSGTRICPSVSDGFAYLSDKLSKYLEGFEDVGIDFVVSFPYDAGGCGCERCWPWGARGYVTICKEFSRLAKERYPGCKFVLGTWCYDVLETSDGEYDGLEAVLAEDSSWVDSIMADGHEDFPAYPLQPGTLAGLPIINFAEISMWGRFPWGGSGANPLPARFQDIWNQSGHRLDGGLPYSEGNFEDINKAIFLQFFWNRDTTADETLRDYIRYEFGESYAPELQEAMYLLEKNYQQWAWERENVERAHAIIMRVHEELPAWAREGWRWQLVYWRAIIDFELATNGRVVTDRCDAAYEAIIALQHLEDGWNCVTPPSRTYRARQAAKAADEAMLLPPGAEPERDAAAKAERTLTA